MGMSVSVMKSLWGTLKEVNFAAIREESNIPPLLLLVGGSEEMRKDLLTALFQGPRAGTALPGRTVVAYPSPCDRFCEDAAKRADAILYVSGNSEVSDLRRRGYVVIEVLTKPEIPPRPASVVWNEDSKEEFFRRLSELLVKSIPSRQTALARAFPALRPHLLKRLVEDVSWQNATYILMSGIGEMVPVLNISVDMADMLILTKNQAIMAYRIALGMGEEGSAEDVLPELLSVVGSGFLWRQAARQLIGLIPGWGVVPQVLVAYAGTYATGMAVYQWYATGRKLSKKEMRGLYKQAMARGKLLLPKIKASVKKKNHA